MTIKEMIENLKEIEKQAGENVKVTIENKEDFDIFYLDCAKEVNIYLRHYKIF